MTQRTLQRIMLAVAVALTIATLGFGWQVVTHPNASDEDKTMALVYVICCLLSFAGVAWVLEECAKQNQRFEKVWTSMWTKIGIV